jgi:metal-responsive CopG/Arc/MetJ family transcriptional regulator
MVLADEELQELDPLIRSYIDQLESRATAAEARIGTLEIKYDHLKEGTVFSCSSALAGAVRNRRM